MKQQILRVLVLILLLVLLGTVAYSQPPTAEYEYTFGVFLYERGDVNAALKHFEQAVVLDPRMTKAYLAIGAAADLWYGSNDVLVGTAITAYKHVLAIEPTHAVALKYFAFALYRSARRDEAEIYYRKALILQPDDPEVLDGIAAISAGRAWPDVMIAKSRLNLAENEALIDASECTAIRARNIARVEEGITLLSRALRKTGPSTDLMSHLSWLYLIRAEIRCGDRKSALRRNSTGAAF